MKKLTHLNNMKRYYIVENDQQSGPFSIEELKSKKLKNSTLVRAEDIQDWNTADKIDDLRNVLFPEPDLSSKTTELPAPQSRRSRSTSSQPSAQPQQEIQPYPPIRRSRPTSSAQPSEPSPLSTVAASAASSVKSSAKSASKKLKLIKLKASTIKYILAGIGSAAVLTLIVIFGMKYLESSKYTNLGLIPVKSGNQWGYIDSKGKYAINPQFQDADYFFDGLARVVASDGRVGYIGEDGNYVIAPDYKDGTPFSDGLAFVVPTGGHIICIDQSGNMRFTVEQAEQISNFHEGIAIFVTAEGKHGFIDISGKIIVNPQFDRAYLFNEDLAAVFQAGKWGFIDRTGNIVINPQFEEVYSFTDGKACYRNGGKYGYIDKSGKIIINPQFEYAVSFADGMAPIKSGEKYGYINEKGNIQINPQYDMVMFFRNGLAPVKQNNLWGFINKKQNVVIDHQYETVSVLPNGIIFVKNANTWGIIDNTGKYLVNPQFETIQQWSDSKSAYIVSDYYDTSTFVSTLFERIQDDSFDGFNASSTLKTLLDNTTYGNDVNAASAHRVIYGKPQRITNDILIRETAFNFDNPVYSYSNHGRQYYFDEKIAYIKYNLNISGEAVNHLDVIIEALKAELEKRYEIEMKKIGGFHGYHDSYSGFDAKSNTDFSICIDDNLDLYVGFSQDILARFFDN